MCVSLPEDRLRQQFNEGLFHEQLRVGRLWPHVTSRHPAALAGEDAEVESQFVRYIDRDGREVAQVHQYVRADGTLAASGKPDPKMVVIDGIRYILEEPESGSTGPGDGVAGGF